MSSPNRLDYRKKLRIVDAFQTGHTAEGTDSNSVSPTAFGRLQNTTKTHSSFIGEREHHRSDSPLGLCVKLSERIGVGNGAVFWMLRRSRKNRACLVCERDRVRRLTLKPNNHPQSPNRTFQNRTRRRFHTYCRGDRFVAGVAFRRTLGDQKREPTRLAVEIVETGQTRQSHCYGWKELDGACHLKNENLILECLIERARKPGNAP